MSLFTIRMVADISDPATKIRLRKYWNFLSVKDRVKCLTKMGYDSKYFEMYFEDLSPDIQSKLFIRNVTV